MEYKKPPLTYEEQLNLLINRGLIVQNREFALQHLRNVSYYRLSAYFLPFKEGEQFKTNVHFERVSKLYLFDRGLRQLLLEAIEPIEIALRTKIIYHVSHAYGAFGYLQSANFSKRFNHASWLKRLKEKINDSNETFILHFKRKYTAMPHMPLWMALEVESFGGLSRVYSGLHGYDQQAIAAQFDLTDVVLSSWLHTLVYVRNLCAHHGRLWNRSFSFKPKLPKKLQIGEEASKDRLYCLLAIVQYLTVNIDPQSSWNEKLLALLLDNPEISLRVMGFPPDWDKQAVWKLSRSAVERLSLPLNEPLLEEV